MDIYIKPAKKIALANNKKVYVKDVADVFAPESILKQVKNVKLLEIKENKRKNYLITIIDIISAIDKALPGHTLNNVGEMDTVVEYSPKKSKDNSIFKIIKIAAITIILFAGSSTAIMSFHSDSQMAKVLENYYYIFFNEKVENPFIVDFPYSIGLALGITVFFNHFSGKKLTTDPTPIEVEMSVYETEVTDNIIDTLNTSRMKEGGGNNGDS